MAVGVLQEEAMFVVRLLVQEVEVLPTSPFFGLGRRTRCSFSPPVGQSNPGLADVSPWGWCCEGGGIVTVGTWFCPASGKLE